MEPWIDFLEIHAARLIADPNLKDFYLEQLDNMFENQDLQSYSICVAIAFRAVFYESTLFPVKKKFYEL